MAVRAILQALDCKDSYTYGHSMRVTYYALLLGKEIGLDKEEPLHFGVGLTFS